MADTGAQSPGTLANDAGIGSTAWSNPGNAASSNNSYATNACSGITNYLKATNFDFSSIPSGATIDGIKVEVEAFTNFTAFEHTIKLVKGGVVSGDNKSAAGALNVGDPGTYTTYGGIADLWGVALADTDVNSSDFGVVLAYTNGGKGSPTVSVDHIRITVYYTAAAGGATGSAFFALL
jgi:hypothetical protein